MVTNIQETVQVEVFIHLLEDTSTHFLPFKITIYSRPEKDDLLQKENAFDYFPCFPSGNLKKPKKCNS